MVDLQLSDFTVLSSFQDYDVQFIEDFEASLDSEITEGDVIILDRIIFDLYHKKLNRIQDRSSLILIDATESQKSYLGIVPIIENLVSSGFKKNHRLIAIGGGITQDVTAFIASILYRGVPWIFFPTTLLAQGDSCIGSKTSINFDKYKNQVGGFYPARKVFIDSSFLSTLPEIQIKSGMGEMCHYFIISGKEDFDFFKRNYNEALRDKKVMASIISRSLQIKKSYIEIDEFDKKERQVFNYGHSFGHAIESITNYRIPHGIAVSYGMDLANFISVKEGYIPGETREYIRELLQEIWKDTDLGKVSLNEYMAALKRDKKNVGNQLGIILNKGIGKIFKTRTELDETFAGWLQEYFENEI